MRAAHNPLCDHYCVFSVGGGEFAISAAAVREVADLVPVVAVPHSSPVLKGICHHRNEFLPVLLLPDLLGEWMHDELDWPYLLILEGSEGPWALPISRAFGLETLEIAPVGESAGDASRPLVMGTASFRDGVVRILNPDALQRAALDVLCEGWSRRGARKAAPHGLSLSHSGAMAEVGS